MSTRLVVLLAFLVVWLPLSAPVGADHPLDWHWVRRGAPVQVLLIDTTRGRYPVAQAAANWRNEAIRFVPAESCPVGRGCTFVRLRDMDYLGLTTLQHDGTHLQRAWVDLNATRRLSASKRLSIVCHELGHALGLGHRQASESCLVNAHRFPPHPDAHDHRLLTSQYNHRH